MGNVLHSDELPQLPDVEYRSVGVRHDAELNVWSCLTERKYVHNNFIETSLITVGGIWYDIVYYIVMIL